jgi:hypothetical protein
MSTLQIVPAGRMRPRPRRPAANGASPLVLRVDFVSRDGSRWSALGDGASLAEAVAFARESCPAGPDWQPVGWEQLLGD